MCGGLSLAFVVAQPDDDACGIVGTVALHASDPRFRFILIHAIDGGGGDIPEGFAATRQSLGRIRRAEDEAAWRALGRKPDRHEWLGFPDGGFGQVPSGELTEATDAILQEERPTVVGTFGPDGIFPQRRSLPASSPACPRQGTTRQRRQRWHH